MSKMDNLRAMREARYEQAMKRAGSATGTAKARPPVAPPAEKAATKKAATKRPAAKSAAPAVEASTDELCGHRNMGGKSCTREKGHAAKSHRYS